MSAVISGIDVVTPAHVHKHNPSQVLITGTEPLGDGSYLAHYRIPAGHVLACEGLQMCLGIELLRQSGTAVAHHYLEQPLSTVHSLTAATFDWVVQGGRTNAVEAGTVMVATSTARRSTTYTFEAYDTLGEPIARGCITADAMPRSVFERMRRGKETSATLTRADEGLWDGGELAWHTEHPFFFDHPYDHLPGMLFVAALETRTPDATGLDIQFVRYAELDMPVSATSNGPVTLFTQAGQDVARAVVRA